MKLGASEWLHVVDRWCTMTEAEVMRFGFFQLASIGKGVGEFPRIVVSTLRQRFIEFEEAYANRNNINAPLYQVRSRAVAAVGEGAAHAAFVALTRTLRPCVTAVLQRPCRSWCGSQDAPSGTLTRRTAKAGSNTWTACPRTPRSVGAWTHPRHLAPPHWPPACCFVCPAATTSSRSRSSRTSTCPAA